MRPCLAMMTAALLLLLGCDDVFLVDPAPAVVTVDDWCTEDARLFVLVTIKDLEDDDVDLSLLVDGEGLLSGPAGDGLRGLTSARGDGIQHRIHWASALDLSSADADAVCGLDDFSGASICVPAPDAPRRVEIIPVTREGGAGDSFPLEHAPGACEQTALPGLPDAGQ